MPFNNWDIKYSIDLIPAYVIKFIHIADVYNFENIKKNIVSCFLMHVHIRVRHFQTNNLIFAYLHKVLQSILSVLLYQAPQGTMKKLMLRYANTV